MGVLDFVGLGKTIAAPIDSVGKIIKSGYDSENEKLGYDELFSRIKQNPEKWNFILNKINANDVRFFISGWRPFIGWVCGICLMIYYVPQFILAAYLWVIMCLGKSQIVSYPIDPSSLMQLIYLMLGFGAYKSIENILISKK